MGTRLWHWSRLWLSPGRVCEQPPRHEYEMRTGTAPPRVIVVFACVERELGYRATGATKNPSANAGKGLRNDRSVIDGLTPLGSPRHVNAILVHFDSQTVLLEALQYPETTAGNRADDHNCNNGYGHCIFLT